MKKLIMALIALAFAFAVSSCCDQSYCPGNRSCNDEEMRGGRAYPQSETPYRWDNNVRTQQGQERQHRRW